MVLRLRFSLLLNIEIKNRVLELKTFVHTIGHQYHTMLYTYIQSFLPTLTHTYTYTTHPIFSM